MLSSSLAQSKLPTGRLRWRFGDAELDESQLRLLVGGTEQELEPRPLQALMFFLRHAGEVVTKSELLENLWPGRIVTEASLSVCVAKLRQALNDEDQSLIRTVHGYGYRLAVPVTVETAAPPAIELVDLRLAAGLAPPLRPDWRLVRRLGAGGFGEAWLCEHSQLHEQRVFKFSTDGAQLSALKREVTLFRLFNDEWGERPDLLRLLDWNFAAPPFFIEMEYCPDGSLAQWAQSHGGVVNIPLAQRLELFAQIAGGVAAAHALGILHKDLKPANILIARDAQDAPLAKISDWGSGWLLDAERLQNIGITRMGFTQSTDSSDTGTALYQAPEVQAGQPATVQGDIYSLGVLLYQLMIGDFGRALAVGWENDVQDELLRGDIAHAADGDCTRRLADASALAQRIRELPARRRELELQKQQAEHARYTQEQLKTLSVRRQWAWTVAATFLIGFVVSSVMYFDARRAQRRAVAISDFLTKDLLSSANPTTAGGRDVKVREILGTAAATMHSRFARDPDTLLALQTALGGAYAGLDMRDQSEALLKPALASAVAHHGHDSRQAQHVREAMLDLYVGQRDLVALAKLANESLAIERETGNADSEFAIQTEQNIAAMKCWTDGYAACQPEFEKLLQHTDRALGPDHEISARIAVTYSSVLNGLDQREQAMAMAEDGLTRLRNALGTEHPLVLTRSVHIGYLLQNAGRASEAIVSLEALVPKIEQTYGADSTYANNAQQMLALAYSKGGRAAEAVAIFERRAAERRVQFGELDKESRLARRRLSAAMIELGRKDEALRQINALLVLHEQEIKKDPDEKTELLRLRGLISTSPAVSK